MNEPTPGEVRVRYAPSPTGYPHVGNIRTALFNWLLARRYAGKFLLRIEDTDIERKVEGALEEILESLRWMGMDWDEGPDKGGEYGPYVQSERLPLYQEAARQLVEQGHAYYCFCSPERLEEMRAEQVRRSQPPGYDRRCRHMTSEEQARCREQGLAPVVRFRVPLTGRTQFRDLIKGKVTFDHSTVDDFVLLKSDGYPTYHLASVVDDHFMQITHVLRADEWLVSTPRHIMLYQALGYEPPNYAHLPMILGPDKAKLSKRHGATSLLEFRDEGYLPEALMNFLALLGWSLDDRTEIIPRETLIENFSLERISKTAAVFNIDKLRWMNGVYIRAMSVDELTGSAMPFLEKYLPPQVRRPLDAGFVRRVVELEQERIKTLKELPETAAFFFLEQPEYDSALLLDSGLTAEQAKASLEASLEIMRTVSPFAHDELEAAFRALSERLSLKTKHLFGLIRIALTGSKAAPPLFSTMVVLGRDRCIRTLELAVEHLDP